MWDELGQRFVNLGEGYGFNTDNGVYGTTNMADFNASMDTPLLNRAPMNSGNVGASGLGAFTQAALGVVNTAVNIKGLSLAEKQFKAENAVAKINLENTGITVNNAIQNAGEVGLALAGNTMTQAQRDNARANTAKKFVKTKMS